MYTYVYIYTYLLLVCQHCWLPACFFGVPASLATNSISVYIYMYMYIFKCINTNIKSLFKIYENQQIEYSGRPMAC